MTLTVAVKSKWRDEKEILREVCFQALPGEIVSIVGRTGCGKTTLLRIIAGLEKDFDGEVTLPDGGGRPFQCGFVFQDARLLPWYTVAQNIAFGLPKTQSKEARSESLERILRIINLESHAGHLPAELSGGLQKLTAIGRALAIQPDLMLLDEPFSSLDPPMRFALHDIVLRVQQQGRFAAILVTHDVDEAVYLSDQIIVLGGKPGTIVETLPVPLPRPRNRLAAEFMKMRNHLFERFV